MRDRSALIGDRRRVGHPGPVLSMGAALVALVVAALVIGRSRFTTNDDVIIRSIASGALGGAPDAHLVFVNVVIGAPLAGLYRLTHSIPWYALLLNGLALVSAAAVLLPVRRRRWSEIVSTGLAVGVALVVVVTLQTFTATAMFAAAAGMALHRQRLLDGRTRWRDAALPVALLAAGAALRFDGALLAAALSEVVLLAGDRRVWSRSHLRFLAAGALAVLALRGVDVWSYRVDHGWSAFWDLNVPRSQLHSTPRLADSAPLDDARARAGWSVTDLELFRRWLHTDRSLFTPRSLDILLEGTSGRTSGRTWWRVVVDDVYRPYRVWLWWFVPASVVGAVLRRRAAVAVAASLVVWGAAGAYLAQYQRFPQRVAVSALACLVLLGPVARGPVPRPRLRIGGRAVVGAMLIIAALVPTALLVRDNARRAGRDARTLAAQISAYRALDVRAIVIVGSTVDLEGQSSFAQDVWSPDEALVLSWSNLSPSYDRQLARLDIGEPIRSAAERDDVFLVVPQATADDYVAILDRWLLETGYAGPPLAVRAEADGLAFLS